LRNFSQQCAHHHTWRVARFGKYLNARAAPSVRFASPRSFGFVGQSPVPKPTTPTMIMNPHPKPTLRRHSRLTARLALLTLASAVAASAQVKPSTATESPQKPVPVESASSADTSGADKAIQLSPFTVTADTKGYFQSN